jgi:hypothetical protein
MCVGFALVLVLVLVGGPSWTNADIEYTTDTDDGNIFDTDVESVGEGLCWWVGLYPLDGNSSCLSDWKHYGAAIYVVDGILACLLTFELFLLKWVSTPMFGDRLVFDGCGYCGGFPKNQFIPLTNCVRYCQWCYYLQILIPKYVLPFILALFGLSPFISILNRVLHIVNLQIDLPICAFFLLILLFLLTFLLIVLVVNVSSMQENRRQILEIDVSEYCEPQNINGIIPVHSSPYALYRGEVVYVHESTTKEYHRSTFELNYAKTLILLSLFHLLFFVLQMLSTLYYFLLFIVMNGVVLIFNSYAFPYDVMVTNYRVIFIYCQLWGIFFYTESVLHKDMREIVITTDPDLNANIADIQTIQIGEKSPIPTGEEGVFPEELKSRKLRTISIAAYDDGFHLLGLLERVSKKKIRGIHFMLEVSQILFAHRDKKRTLACQTEPVPIFQFPFWFWWSFRWACSAIAFGVLTALAIIFPVYIMPMGIITILFPPAIFLVGHVYQKKAARKGLAYVLYTRQKVDKEKDIIEF